MDDEVERRVAGAAPRAPAGFAATVEARIEGRRKARARRIAVTGALVVLSAAALVLVVLRPAPAPNAPARRQEVASPLARRVAPPAPAGQTASPALEAAEVSALAQAGGGALRACYEKALHHDRKLAGALIVRLRIVAQGGAGHIDGAEVLPESTPALLGARAFVPCVLDGLRRSRLAPPKQPLEVTYPILFASAPAPAEDEPQLFQPRF